MSRPIVNLRAVPKRPHLYPCPAEFYKGTQL